MRRHTLLATATAAGLMVGVTAAPAGAALPVEEFTDTWDETSTEVCDLETEDPADDLEIESRFVGSFSGELRARGDTIFFTGSGSEVVTNTNVDTGLSWVTTYRWSDRDIRVLEVDGDVYTFEVATVFHFRVLDGDGRLAGANDGRFTAVIVYDAGADEVVSESDFRVVGRLGAGDFCGDAVLFTT